MPDSTTVLNWIQSIGVLAALIFTAREVLARKKEQRFRNYLDGIAGFIDDTKLLVENKDLHGLYNYSPDDLGVSYERLSDVQKSLVHYCDLIIARCETLWLASQEGWVPEDEWRYWKTWMRELGGSPVFRWTVDWCANDYSEEFLSLVREENANAVAQLKSLGNKRPQPASGGPAE